MLRAFYDAEATNRAERTIVEWKRREREDFVNVLVANGLQHVMELGSGPGRDAQYFMQEHGRCVACLDLSPEMVRICRERGLEAHLCDFADGLNVPDASVDAVYAMNSLLHVPKYDLPGVVESVARAVRPGGLFYVGVYGGGDFEGPWQADPSGESRFFAFYTDAALLDVLTANSQFVVEYLRRVNTGQYHAGTADTPATHFQSVLLRRVVC